MDEDLLKRHADIRERARDVAENVTARHAAKHDRGYTVPIETLQALHANGLLNLCIDRSIGGEGTGMLNGVDPLAYLLVIEEIGRVDMSAAHCFQVDVHTCQLITAAGNEDQKRRYLGPAFENGALFSWTGSEPGRTARGQYNLISDAKRVNGGYMLNGVKNFATLASIAEWNVVGVNVDGIEPPDSFMLVMVPRGAEGFVIDESWWRPTGMRGAVSPKIDLKELHVPDEDVIQEPGFYPRSRFGARLHLGFAANHLGAAQGLYDFAVEYLPKRGAAANPHAQRTLGEMRMHIAASRQLLYEAARMWDGGRRKDADVYSLMAKLHCISTAEWMVAETIRVVGSTALLETYPVHRIIRDIHVHSTHANLHNTAQSIGRDALKLEFDATQQQ